MKGTRLDSSDEKSIFGFPTNSSKRLTGGGEVLFDFGPRLCQVLIFLVADELKEEMFGARSVDKGSGVVGFSEGECLDPGFGGGEGKVVLAEVLGPVLVGSHVFAGDDFFCEYKSFHLRRL